MTQKLLAWGFSEMLAIPHKWIEFDIIEGKEQMEQIRKSLENIEKQSLTKKVKPLRLFLKEIAIGNISLK